MTIVFIRAIILYILIILALRLMGKRQIGELQPSELVITILISNMAAIPIEDTNIPMSIGAIPIIGLVSFELILSLCTLKSKRLRNVVSGSPLVLIRDGVIDQKAMKKIRFSIDDLMESLRGNNVFDIQDVNYAIVETTGKISVLQKFDAQTVTPKIMDIKGTETAPPAVVISDGKIMNEPMEAYKLGMDWLLNTVKSNKLTVDQVFLMTADRDANYYIVPKDKK